jgi:hypothetical protein
MAEKVPTVIVNPDDYKEIILKLNEIEEKIEFTNSEIHQRYGKKTGKRHRYPVWDKHGADHCCGLYAADAFSIYFSDTENAFNGDIRYMRC